MIKLEHSAVIHIPKTGGNWINNMLIQHVKGCKIKKRKSHIYVTHETPYTDVPVFAVVRDPAEFAHSLWHHRKKATMKRFGYIKWDLTKKLETRCGHSDYLTFMHNVADFENGVADFYKSYYYHYPQVTVGKMETMCEDLINFLKSNNEDFSEDAIRNNANKMFNVNTRKPKIDPELKTMINSANKDFCIQMGYSF